MTDRVPAASGVDAEEDAYRVLEVIRWGAENRAVCPFCGEGDAYFITPENGASRQTRTGAWSERRVWTCRSCRQQFSVLTRTPLAGTKLSLCALVDMSIEPVHVREAMRRYQLCWKSASNLLRLARDLRENGLPTLPARRWDVPRPGRKPMAPHLTSAVIRADEVLARHLAKKKATEERWRQERIDRRERRNVWLAERERFRQERKQLAGARRDERRIRRAFAGIGRATHLAPRSQGEGEFLDSRQHHYHGDEWADPVADDLDQWTVPTRADLLTYAKQAPIIPADFILRVESGELTLVVDDEGVRFVRLRERPWLIIPRFDPGVAVPSQTTGSLGRKSSNHRRRRAASMATRGRRSSRSSKASR